MQPVTRHPVTGTKTVRTLFAFAACVLYFMFNTAIPAQVQTTMEQLGPGVQGVKTRIVNYVQEQGHELFYIQTFYRITNTSGKPFKPGGQYGFEFYVPPEAKFMKLAVIGSQNMHQLPQGHAPGYLSLPNGLPPGQAFLEFSFAVGKKDGQTVLSDQVAYDGFKNHNWYWQAEGLKIATPGRPMGKVKEGSLFMGRPGFTKRKLKYPGAGQPVQVTLSGGKPQGGFGSIFALGGGPGEGAQGGAQAQGRSKGKVEIENGFLSDLTVYFVSLVMLFLVGGLLYTFTVHPMSTPKPMLAGKIKHYRKLLTQLDRRIAGQKDKGSIRPDDAAKRAALVRYVDSMERQSENG